MKWTLKTGLSVAASIVFLSMMLCVVFVYVWVVRAYYFTLERIKQMNKALAWLIGTTKVGKGIFAAQQFVSGYKTYLGAAGLGIPALVTIVMKFSEQGTPYLMGVMATPEFRSLMEAVTAAGLRAAVTKAADPKQDPNYPNQSPTPVRPA